MVAGRIAMQHLQEKAMHRSDWIQLALAPMMTESRAKAHDHRGFECACDVRLDLVQGMGDIVEHAWASWSSVEL
jgi:hypothetical protein